jgi:hypothetical protein
MSFQRFVPISFFLVFLTTCTPLPDYILSAINPPITKTRKATLLSAFFGLDNALPITASGIWKEAPGKDGMPLVFSHEIDPKTLDAADFLITTRDSSTRKVGFASFKPAVEAFELRTILLIGELGNAPNNEPVEVSIVGDLKSRDGQNLKGQKIAVTPLAEGPFLSYAEFFTLEDDYPHNSKKRGCDCPKNNTAVVVRTVWAGGVHALNGEELGEHDLHRFKVKLVYGADTTIVTPIKFADLNDNDNNIDLCIQQPGTPISVEVKANTAIDPRKDKNPKTGIKVVSRW